MNPTPFSNGPAAAPSFRAGSISTREDAGRTTLLAAATSALWIGCLVVGILGVLLPYAREHLQPKPRPPIVEAVHLIPPRDQAPAAAQPDPGPKPDTPPPNASPPPPNAPPPIPVAEPSKAIAFAVPVEGPTQIVNAKLAVPMAAPAAAPVQHLSFGVGQGQQPPPEYPEDARIAGEQGTVTVEFTVDAQGRVVSATVSRPSRWPLLNQAALRAVKYRWRFNPGKPGTYDIPIQFQLTGN